MSNLTEKAGVLTVAGVLKQLFRIFIIIFLARFLTQESFGTFKQVQLLFSFISPVLLAGLPAGVLYFLPHIKNKKEILNFISQAMTLMVLSGAVIAFAVATSALWSPTIFHNPRLGPLLIIFSFIAFAEVSVGFLRPTLIVLNKVTPLLIFTLALSLATLLAVIFSAIGSKGNLSVIYVFYALVYVGMFFLGLLYIKKLLPKLTLSVSREGFIKQLKYAIPLGLTSTVGLLAWELDKLIVSINFTPAMYAIYVVGATEIPFIAQIRSAVNDVALPEMSKMYLGRNLSGIVGLWHSSIRKISLLILPMFVFSFVFAPEIIIILFSSNYLNSTLYFRIYLFLIIIRVASYGLILQAIGKTSEIFRGAVIFLIINLILNIVLVRIIGLAGPAVATVIATFVLALYYVLVIRKFMEFSFNKILPWLEITKTLLFSILSIVPILPLVPMNFNPVLKIVLAAILYFPIFFGAIYVFRVIKEEDKRFVASYLQKFRSSFRNLL